MTPTPGLTIGYKASAEQFGPRELVDLGVRAEEVGLDSVMVSDHLQPWRHAGGHAPNALACLAALGERTERVVLGTSVLTPTFRYHPAVVAQQFATLSLLNPGRVILGVGTGEALNELSIGLAEWPEFKERFARLREAVRLMRTLWTEERVSFEGDHYTTSDATVYDRPEDGVPIYVAAGGPTMAKYAGRVGDGFICTSGKGMELYTDTLLPAVADGLSAAGRPPDAISRMIEIKLSFASTRAEALDNTRFWAPLSLAAEEKHRLGDPIEMAAAADRLPIEEVAKRWIVATSPEAVVDEVRPYVDAGFDHLVFHAPGHDQERFLTAFGRDVAPLLRRLVPGRSVEELSGPGAEPAR